MTAAPSSRRRGRPPSPEKGAAILEAATASFLRDGYAGTSLDAVAAAAGVSKQTVYSRFGDKERLFRAVVEAARSADGPPKVMPDLAGAPDLRAALEAFAVRHQEITQRPRIAALRRLMIAELARRPALREQWDAGEPAAAFAHLERQFALLHEGGRLDVPDPLRAARHLIAILSHEGAMRSLHGVRPLTTDERRELAVEAVDTFLRAWGTGRERRLPPVVPRSAVMETARLRACLDAEFHRLREVAAGGDTTAAVPSCPGWTLADLVRHVATVYLHKAACMTLGREPDPWPPAGLDAEAPLPLLDRAFAGLCVELDARAPGEESYTWYEPDRTVGFWVRRMAQETVVHRVDAELAAGVPVTPVADDLALDGVDEVLVAFLAYSTVTWPDYFTATPAAADGRRVRIATPQRHWDLLLTGADIQVVAPGAREPGATVTGSPTGILLWLWNRAGADIPVTEGDSGAIALLREALVTATR